MVAWVLVLTSMCCSLQEASRSTWALSTVVVRHVSPFIRNITMKDFPTVISSRSIKIGQKDSQQGTHCLPSYIHLEEE